MKGIQHTTLNPLVVTYPPRVAFVSVASDSVKSKETTVGYVLYGRVKESKPNNVCFVLWSNCVFTNSLV